jgi:hypothetical protein
VPRLRSACSAGESGVLPVSQPPAGARLSQPDMCQNVGGRKASAKSLQMSEPTLTGGVTVVSTEVERASGVDVADVPSAKWGWSRINHRTWHIVGLCIFGFLLLMLRGNHVGHVEDWFLLGFAALVLFAVVRDWWGRRRGWIR